MLYTATISRTIIKDSDVWTQKINCSFGNARLTPSEAYNGVIWLLNQIRNCDKAGFTEADYKIISFKMEETAWDDVVPTNEGVFSANLSKLTPDTSDPGIITLVANLKNDTINNIIESYINSFAISDYIISGINFEFMEV